MTRELPLLLSLMGLTAKTISPYARAFPDARGFFARLSPDEQGGAPSTRPASLLAALRGLHVRRDRGAGGRVGTRPGSG